MNTNDLMDYCHQFLYELNKEINALGKSQQDRESLLNNTPIVLVAKNITEEEVCAPGEHEYVVERFMQLGRDIDCILTAEEHVPRVKQHLIDNGLADTVKVFSLSVLS